MSYQVLITSRMFAKYSPEPLQRLLEAGCEILPNPYEGKTLTEEQLLALIGEADGVILGNENFTERVFAAAPRLKVVSRFGIGYDRVDLQAAARHGVVVTIVPGANTDAVAELTIGLIIALARRIPEADRRVKAGEFPTMLGFELRGKHLGVVGFGRIGQAVARIARAMGMEVLAYDVVDRQAEAGSLGAATSSLEHLLQVADVVTIHVPGGQGTRHLLGREQLNSMKKGSYLVNTSRAQVVDTQALAALLRAGHLSGAAVDVFEIEPPPPDHPLMGLPNVITTPHIGGFTEAAIDRTGLVAAENLLRVLQGQPPLHPVVA